MLSQCLPSSESPGFLNHCPLPGSPKEVLSHDASLPPESAGFLNCSSLPGSSRRWSVSSSTHWGRFCLGTGPGPYLILWPFLVSWSIPPMSPAGARPSRASEHQSERESIYRQVAWLLVCLGVPSLHPSQATSLAVQRFSMIGISLGPPEMLQKLVLEKPSTTLGELEKSGLLHWRAQRS